MLFRRPQPILKPAILLVASIIANNTLAQTSQCSATSGQYITPVVEVFTSEGCSSCPPADNWASSFKEKAAAGDVVVQVFHVGYWDYIGWVDRFAAPAYTQRQREVAAKNKLLSIYTPQAVLNGKDWPDWHGKTLSSNSQELAKANISIIQTSADRFDATVTPLPALVGASWSAYWTLTEHGHNSKVLAGENAREFLKHDFVVRQLVQAGDYKSSDASVHKLSFNSITRTPGHPRQINLVVTDNKTGRTLQAASLSCAS